MGWWDRISETKEERREREVNEAHDEGQRDGAEGISDFRAGAKAAFKLDHELGEAYLSGVANGEKNQPQK